MDGLIQYYCIIFVLANRGIFLQKFEGKVLNSSIHSLLYTSIT